MRRLYTTRAYLGDGRKQSTLYYVWMPKETRFAADAFVGRPVFADVSGFGDLIGKVTRSLATDYGPEVEIDLNPQGLWIPERGGRIDVDVMVDEARNGTRINRVLSVTLRIGDHKRTPGDGPVCPDYAKTRNHPADRREPFIGLVAVGEERSRAVGI